MRNSIDAVAREEGGADAPARGKHVSTADFMISLQEQERAQRMRDIATQRLLPAAQMRERMQLSPQALSAALKTKRIFALSGPSDAYVYPAFFADPSYERRALERVSQALGDLPGSSKWDFFTKPRLSLGGKTPLQAIAKGRGEAVMNLAKAFREQ